MGVIILANMLIAIVTESWTVSQKERAGESDIFLWFILRASTEKRSPLRGKFTTEYNGTGCQDSLIEA